MPVDTGWPVPQASLAPGINPAQANPGKHIGLHYPVLAKGKLFQKEG